MIYMIYIYYSIILVYIKLYYIINYKNMMMQRFFVRIFWTFLAKNNHNKKQEIIIMTILVFKSILIQ